MHFACCMAPPAVAWLSPTVSSFQYLVFAFSQHDAVAQVAVLGAAPGAPPLLAALKRYQQYNPPATFKMDTNVLPQVIPYHSPLSLFTHRGNSAQGTGKKAAHRAACVLRVCCPVCVFLCVCPVFCVLACQWSCAPVCCLPCAISQ